MASLVKTVFGKIGLLIFMLIQFAFVFLNNPIQAQRISFGAQYSTNKLRAVAGKTVKIKHNESLVFNEQLATQVQMRIYKKEDIRISAGINYSFLQNTSIFPLNTSKNTSTIEYLNRYHAVGLATSFNYLIFNKKAEMGFLIFPSVIIRNNQINRCNCSDQIQENISNDDKIRLVIPLQIALGRKFKFGERFLNLGVQLNYSTNSWDSEFKLKPILWGIHCVYSWGE